MIKKSNWWKAIIVAFYTVFFGVLLITGEPMYLGDSFQHENQFVSREPLYALIIQLLRILFPEIYRWVLISIQCILAIVCYSIFTIFMMEENNLPLLFVPIQIGILISPHVITPIVSSTNMVITNSIMTEGITYSLFQIFLISIIKLINKKAELESYAAKALLWALLLSLIRGQLLVLIAVWTVIIILKGIKNRNFKTLLIYILMLIITAMCRSVAIKTYNFLEQGYFVSTVSGKAMSLANVLYVSDRDAGENIKDEGFKQLFYEIYDECEEKECNYKYSPQGIINRAEHHESCHEMINFDIFMVKAKEYLASKEGQTVAEYQDNYQKVLIETDKVADELQKSLLPTVLPEYIYNYMAICSMGFIRSVAFVNPILNWYAIIMYLISIIIIILSLKRNIESRSAKMMMLVLLMITGNVTATSLYLECVSRYMIYMLPVFYSALLLTIHEFIRSK